MRADPVRHEVRHRSYQWFVDLDELPRLPHGLRRLARFESRDHLGDPARSLRANVDAYLASTGIDLRGGRITMLTNARSVGYVFNPLTLYWCHDAGRCIRSASSPRCTTPTGSGTGTCCDTDDAGRVDDREAVLRLAVLSGRRLVPDEPARARREARPHDHVAPAWSAARSPRPSAASPFPSATRTVVAAALRHPLETWVVRALITVHGIRLWRKGLAVQPRPAHRVRPEPEDHVVRHGCRSTGCPHPRHGRHRPAGAAAGLGRQRGRAGRRPRAGASARGARCAGCCGRRASWGWRARTSPATSTSTAISPTGSGGRGSSARSRPSTGVALASRRQAASGRVAAARLGAIGPPPKPPASARPGCPGGCTPGCATAPRSRTTTTCPTTSTSCCSTSTMAYSSAYFTDAGPVAGRRAARQARPDLPQARPAARACDCSTSAAAGDR